MNQQKRTTIRTILAVGGATLAGCLGGINDPQTQTPDETPTTTRGQQEPSDPPTRTETTESLTPTETIPITTRGNCNSSPPQPDESQLSVQPGEYPEFPSSIEVAQARVFALTFDRAYQRNKYIVQEQQDGGPDPGSVSISDHGVVRTVDAEQGVVVGINGWLTAQSEPIVITDGEETVTDRRETHLPYGAWYHVLSDRLNYLEPPDQISQDGDRPPLAQFRTVYCR